MVTILAFLGGAVSVALLWLFWPEDEDVTYLRGVLAALKDTEHDRDNEAALEYWEDTSWVVSSRDRNEFDRGYCDTISDLRLQLKAKAA